MSEPVKKCFDEATVASMVSAINWMIGYIHGTRSALPHVVESALLPLFDAFPRSKD